VSPPPDGGYPNFITAEGTNALQSLTTGAANTAVGWFSLFSNTDGSFSSKMANQAAIIAQQQKGMEALTAQLKEQAAQIQKVSAQLEVSKRAPQVVSYEK
jgi:hypothetical protein